MRAVVLRALERANRDVIVLRRHLPSGVEAAEAVRILLERRKRQADTFFLYLLAKLEQGRMAEAEVVLLKEYLATARAEADGKLT